MYVYIHILLLQFWICKLMRNIPNQLMRNIPNQLMRNSPNWEMRSLPNGEMRNFPNGKVKNFPKFPQILKIPLEHHSRRLRFFAGLRGIGGNLEWTIPSPMVKCTNLISDTTIVELMEVSFSAFAHICKIRFFVLKRKKNNFKKSTEKWHT